jgi:hypothetical protein
VPVFGSADAFRRFARSVKQSGRYFRDTNSDAFLDLLLGEAKSRVQLVPTGSRLWRAQLGYELEEHIDFDEEVWAEPVPLPPSRMKPLPDRAREGRANPKGIAYLYLATRRETAMAEVRPWIGSYVSVGQFEILRELRLVNCTEESERMLHFGDPPPERWDEEVWQDVDDAFSRPVVSTDEAPDYVPTQILAEFFKVNGFDGVAYRSSLGQGHNIVLFDPNNAELEACGLYHVKNLSFAFEEATNPYFIRRGDS